jgi:hypothetical protein
MTVTVKQVTQWYSKIILPLLFIFSFVNLFKNQCLESNLISLGLLVLMCFTEYIYVISFFGCCGNLKSNLESPFGYLMKGLLYGIFGISIGFTYLINKSCWLTILYSILIGFSGVSYIITSYCEHLKEQYTCNEQTRSFV